MTRVAHPSISVVGRVEYVGGAMKISGWQLGLCAAWCFCDRHPTAGQLAIYEDQERGLLGLRSFRAGGCRCCEPWTADELVAVVRDLAIVAAMDAPGREPSGR